MALGFGGPDNKLAAFKDAKAVIVPVPYGRTASYRKGTENGPRAILEASDSLELFDEDLNKEIHAIGINTVPLLKVEGLESQEMISVVEDKVSDVFKHNKLPVVIGGEHAVTIGAVRAAKKKYKNLSILYFDAHCDLRDSYLGNKYSHACVARRLLDIAPVVEAGVRSLSMEEFEFSSASDVKIIKMPDIIKCPDWASAVKNILSKEVYITIDLDVFDPSIMPSVGNPEPGGMGWYDFLNAAREIIRDKKIAGLDVVELCPIKDMAAPDYMAAKLIYKLLGHIFP
ncbi:MAG: agmatinase [Candidatus Omnitrophica bacterium]|nr:agmatinase [Candidatus Omnitrophota bacterium]MBU4589415.1 agmatinase [Candidatus Omnitrophota bacterium]